MAKVVRMAATSRNLSSHWEIMVTGSLAGAAGRPGPVIMLSSIITSDISINSNSRIFLTTFVGRDAAGLKGPGRTAVGVEGQRGVLPLVVVTFVEAVVAASSLSPGTAVGFGLNSGSCLAGRVSGYTGGGELTLYLVAWQ